MPKSSKKRKEKAADFAKAKLKLGKGKAPAANAIDTSFKARSIALPSQSIVNKRDDDDENVPKTRRHLSIDELFVHLKHYNATVRRDAITGLKELFKAHADLLESHITQTLRACAPVVTDEDATVRKTLLSLFSFIFEALPADKIRPHAPSLLLFITSAQTHIFPEIRVDGVKFLDVLLVSVPDIVTRAWIDHSGAPGSSTSDGRRVLSGYLALLNASSSRNNTTDAPTTSGAVLSPASRLLVLRSLSTFLRHAVQTSESSDAMGPLWFLASSFSRRDAFEAFINTLPSLAPSSRRCTVVPWTPDVNPDIVDQSIVDAASDPWSFSHIHDAAVSAAAIATNASTSLEQTAVTRTAELAHTLQPILTAAFLDGVPSLHSVQSRIATSAQVDIDTVVVAIEIVRTLYVAIFSSTSVPQETARDDLYSMLSHMDVYFPFHIAGHYDHQLSSNLQRLNLLYCELSGLLALVQSSPAEISTKPRARSKGKSSQHAIPRSVQMERVAEYVEGLLDTAKVSQPLHAQAYQSLLPSIWALLSVESVRPQVLAATVQHAIQCQSLGSIKPLSTLFIGALLLLRYEKQYCGTFHPPSPITSDLERWLLGLPKLAWELGESNMLLTETIFTFLLRYTQRSDVSPTTVISLCNRLCPYFRISHATRGNLHGPFSKLQSAASGQGSGSLSRLAVDLTRSLSHQGKSTDLEASVQWAVASAGDEYFVQ